MTFWLTKTRTGFYDLWSIKPVPYNGLWIHSAGANFPILESMVPEHLRFKRGGKKAIRPVQLGELKEDDNG